MSEYYLWSSKAAANAALANVNGNPAFPVQGHCAGTGAPVDSWTTCWADAPVQVLDGRWGFPRIPAEFLDRLGITESQREEWLEAFAPAIVADPAFAPPPPSDP